MTLETSIHRNEGGRTESDERAWQKPSLKQLGNINDLIKGGGKSGTNSDQDPQSTTKGGVG